MELPESFLDDDVGAPAATLTLQSINDAIWPPIKVIVPTGTAEAIRERVESDLGLEGRRRVTITESDMVSPGFAYVYNGHAYR